MTSLEEEIEHQFRKNREQVAPKAKANGNYHGANHTFEDTADGPDQQDAEARDDNWGDPDWTLLDDRRGDLPEFPVDVFTPAWQDWLKRASHGAGVRVEHVAVPILGVASSLIGSHDIFSFETP